MPTIISFRAEFSPDVIEFKNALHKKRIFIQECREIFDQVIPDVVVEMVVDAPYHVIKESAKTVPNGHVMVETMAPCDIINNSMERNRGDNDQTTEG